MKIHLLLWYGTSSFHETEFSEFTKTPQRRTERGSPFATHKQTAVLITQPCVQTSLSSSYSTSIQRSQDV